MAGSRANVTSPQYVEIRRVRAGITGVNHTPRRGFDAPWTAVATKGWSSGAYMYRYASY